jgi:hypothetical protein
MLDYASLALAASLLLGPVTAAPYVTPNRNRVPEPQLHYSKADNGDHHSDKVFTSKNPNHGLVPGSAQYSLVDTYDSTNWMSKFTVQNVSPKTIVPSDMILTCLPDR